METARSYPELIGRTVELDHLRAALASANDGVAVTVLLGGEAGVGKTRLVTEFAAEATASSARVFVGQCIDLGGDGLPYAPIAGVLRELAVDVGVDELATLAGPGRGALARLLPEIGEDDPVATARSEDGRGRLFEVVTVLLERLAAQRPLVLVVEDLHWADTSTRDLLRFVVRALPRSRLVVIGTYRSDEIHRGHPLRPFLSELERVRSVRRIEVPPLGRDEVAHQLAALLGRPAAPQVISRIYERSEGLPFFVEELAEAESGPAGAALPDSLRELMLIRIERLADPAQSVLRELAVGGVRVDHAVLEAVSALGPDGLDDALREAVSANILRVDGDGYAFRHALLREAVHDDILPGAHVRLHARYAEVFEANPALIRDGSVAARIAPHWQGAHQHERALRARFDAGTDAMTRYAYAEAQQMFESALRLWEQVRDPATVTGSDHGILLASAAQASENAGNLERALDLVDAALAEPEVVADASRQAALLEQKGRLLGDTGRPEAKSVLTEALTLVAAEPPTRRRAHLLRMLCGQHLMDGSYKLAIETASEAIGAAQRAGSRGAEFGARNVRGAALVHQGRLDEGFAELDAARELADWPRRLVGYHINASDALFVAGRYREAAQTAQAGIEHTRTIGMARSLGAMMAGNAAEPLIALGDWPAAERLITRALELEPPARHLWQLLCLDAALRVWQDNLDAAARSLDEAATRMAGRAPGPQYAVPAAIVAAELALARDDPAAAWEIVARTFEASERLVPAYHGRLAAIGATAVATRARAGDDVAGDIAHLRTISDALESGPGIPVWLAVVTAELADLPGSPDRVTGWRHVIQRLAEAEGPAEIIAFAHLNLGRALAEAGEREPALAELRDAAERAERLGAGLITRWVDDVARRARLPVRSAPNRPAPPGRFGLTERETDVLRLVSAGRTNRQIGNELFISAKTASVHVSNILAKLGVSSRGEAAAAAHEARLFDDEPG